MRMKWILSLFAVSSISVLVVASKLLGQISLPSIGVPIGKIDIKVPVEFGGKPPFIPDPQADRFLKTNGIEFTAPSTPPTNLSIPLDKAVAQSHKYVSEALTQQPSKITVDFVGYTDPKEQLLDKKVWKITYWGAPVRLTGPGPDEKGVLPQIKQPTSQKAVTWVIVDPTSGDPISSFSSGQVSD